MTTATGKLVNMFGRAVASTGGRDDASNKRYRDNASDPRLVSDAAGGRKTTPQVFTPSIEFREGSRRTRRASEQVSGSHCERSSRSPLSSRVSPRDAEQAERTAVHQAGVAFSSTLSHLSTYRFGAKNSSSVATSALTHADVPPSAEAAGMSGIMGARFPEDVEALREQSGETKGGRASPRLGRSVPSPNFLGESYTHHRARHNHSPLSGGEARAHDRASTPRGSISVSQLERSLQVANERLAEETRGHAQAMENYREACVRVQSLQDATKEAESARAHLQRTNDEYARTNKDLSARLCGIETRLREQEAQLREHESTIQDRDATLRKSRAMSTFRQGADLSRLNQAQKSLEASKALAEEKMRMLQGRCDTLEDEKVQLRGQIAGLLKENAAADAGQRDAGGRLEKVADNEIEERWKHIFTSVRALVKKHLRWDSAVARGLCHSADESGSSVRGGGEVETTVLRQGLAMIDAEFGAAAQVNVERFGQFVLQAVIWRALNRASFANEAGVWGGATGAAFAQFYKTFPGDAASLEDWTALRVHGAATIGKFFTIDERALDTAAAAFIQTHLAPFVASPTPQSQNQLYDATKKIMRHAAELYVVFAQSRAIFRIEFPSVLPPRDIAREGHDDGETPYFVLYQSNARRGVAGGEARLLTVVPGLVKYGNADGRMYSHDNEIGQAQVILVA